MKQHSTELFCVVNQACLSSNDQYKLLHSRKRTAGEFFFFFVVFVQECSALDTSFPISLIKMSLFFFFFTFELNSSFISSSTFLHTPFFFFVFGKFPQSQNNNNNNHQLCKPSSVSHQTPQNFQRGASLTLTSRRKKKKGEKNNRAN